MYTDSYSEDIVKAAEFEKLEAERWSFIEQLEADQNEKRENHKKLPSQDSLPRFSTEQRMSYLSYPVKSINR